MAFKAAHGIAVARSVLIRVQGRAGESGKSQGMCLDQ